LVDKTRIIIVEAEQEMAEANIGRVDDDERRNGKAEQKLPEFIGGNSEVPAPVKRDKAEAPMRQKRTIEKKLAHIGAPWPQENAAHLLHRIQPQYAAGMVQEMGRREAEQDQTRGQPQCPFDRRKAGGKGNREQHGWFFSRTDRRRLTASGYPGKGSFVRGAFSRAARFGISI